MPCAHAFRPADCAVSASSLSTAAAQTAVTRLERHRLRVACTRQPGKPTYSFGLVCRGQSIALDIARGLGYLHAHCRVLHLDVRLRWHCCRAYAS